ncbi:putative transcriptional regulator [Dyadobacter jejuensis]|uniref:Putative transcriptional regulator n=1 Tax=Dyadobacter jejuensis TaxID=1082580 RepID=A0A316AI86_9BACT|nr:BlaI/MecI/CopY family transcriptional regulator [Dyadobacter jejuensis]PWJ56674.1 putative transcriptional regulator [Dyadobacter jejuensis]
MYIKPTEAELEILNFLWAHGPSTVRQVHTALAETKAVGYTTTLKLMQIMHDKGFLYRTEKGRSHIYVALLGQEETQEILMNRLIQTAFQGSNMAGLNLLLKNTRLSEKDWQELQKIGPGT